MTTSILIFLFTLALLSFVLLLFKALNKKDISIAGLSLSRLYLVVAIVFYFVVGDYDTAPVYIHMGVVVMFVSDVFIEVLQLVAERAKLRAYDQLYARATHKFHAAVDTAPIPFFTVELEEGTIEYTNQALSDIIGIPRETLIGKPLFEMLNSTCKDALYTIGETGKLSCYIKTSSGIRKAEILGKRTSNGHDTITGSIYFV